MQEKVLKGSRSVFQQLSTNVDVENSCRPLYFCLEKVMVYRKKGHQMPYPLHSRLLAIPYCFNKTCKRNGELLAVMVRAPLHQFSHCLSTFHTLQILVITLWDYASSVPIWGKREQRRLPWTGKILTFKWHTGISSSFIKTEEKKKHNKISCILTCFFLSS